MESNELKRKLNKRHLYSIYAQLLNELNAIDNDIDHHQSKLSLMFTDELKRNVIKYSIDIKCNDINDNNEDYELENKNYEYNKESNTLVFKGYPRNNLLLLLSNNIILCRINQRFAFSFDELEGFNDQTKEVVEMLNNALFKDTTTNKEIKSDYVLGLFKKLTERDILTLIGLRKTPGSINTNLPPDVELLRHMFNEINSLKPIKLNVKCKPSILTVGAKALSKHSHRSKTEAFWPSANGEEKVKNTRANELLEMFIENCVWINIHGLPHEIAIIELRINQGYGLRWQIDGKFRGFLEPMIENGHEKGWIH